MRKFLYQHFKFSKDNFVILTYNLTFHYWRPSFTLPLSQTRYGLKPSFSLRYLTLWTFFTPYPRKPLKMMEGISYRVSSNLKEISVYCLSYWRSNNWFGLFELLFVSSATESQFNIHKSVAFSLDSIQMFFSMINFFWTTTRFSLEAIRTFYW